MGCSSCQLSFDNLPPSPRAPHPLPKRAFLWRMYRPATPPLSFNKRPPETRTIRTIIERNGYLRGRGHPSTSARGGSLSPQTPPLPPQRAFLWKMHRSGNAAAFLQQPSPGDTDKNSRKHSFFHSTDARHGLLLEVSLLPPPGTAAPVISPLQRISGRAAPATFPL